MPYFVWRGVDSVGSYKRGKHCAKSVAHLDAELFKRGVALLEIRETAISWMEPSIHTSDLAHFFKQLSVLVEAGVLLTDALELVARQVTSVRLQELVSSVADKVNQGSSLSNALQECGCLFDRMVVVRVRIGEESGTLPAVLDALSQVYERRLQFHKKLRAALLLPAVTFIFFIAVIICMVVFILPRFADLFKSYNQELPYLTHLMISMSAWISSWYMLIALAATALWVLLVYRWISTKQGRSVWDRCTVRLAIIGPLIVDTCIASFFQSLAQLLQGGVRLVPALQLIVPDIDNTVAKTCVMHIEQELQQGGSLSHALATCPGDFFTQEVIALVVVGQETGRLPELCAKIAQLYQERILERLTLYATFAQPVCMVILGLLVTVLVCAIYGPILNMANMPQI